MKSVATIISAYRKSLGWTQQDLCDRLAMRGIDITPKAVSTWESGTSQPSVSTFFILCEIFGIEDISKEVFGPRSNDKLTLLNELGLSRLDEYTDLLLQNERFTLSVNANTEYTTSSIHLYDTPVSAGLGNILEESTYTEVSRDDSVPRDATFGVRISGDSMTPRFQDGQSVWIKQQAFIENGEIGIFFLDGQVYCKKYKSTKKGTALLSLNTKYAPIQVNENMTFEILGKVVS